MKLKVKIKKLPEFKKGGHFFQMPFAGAIPLNPFGLIETNVKNLDSTYNESIKPIDKDKANLEAEKGEVLLKYDGGGVFRIQGKRHSQGGTPLKADPGDFIFSNDKKLALNKEEAELFSLKYSKRGKAANTPARVLGKEIDIKKYNKFLVSLQDPESDVLAKTTARLMLDKYGEKIGQIAYLQEDKKNFPQGLPDFTQGSAPVYSDAVVDKQDKSKMFAKYGGFMPKAQMGMWRPYGVQRDVSQTPRQQRSYPRNDRYMNSRPPYPATWENYYDRNQKKQYTGPDWINPNQFYSTPGLLDYMGGLDVLQGVDNDLHKADDAVWGYRHEAARERFFPGRERTPSLTRLPNLARPLPPPQGPNIPARNPQPNTVQNVPTVPFEGFNIGMNAQEVLSGIAPYLTAASMPTYYDMLSQKYSPNIRLDRVNNTQEINDIQQQSSLAQREMFAQLPGQVGALASADVRAAEASNIMRSNAGMNNANTQIANQESMTNFDADQRDNLFNIQNVHQTYNNNVLARQRRNEALANGATQSMGNFMAIQNNLDTMNQQASAAVLPYLSEVDAKDENGNPIRVQVPPITFGRNRMPIPTGFGSFDSVGVSQLAGAPNSDDYKSAFEYFISQGATPDKAAQAATIIFYGRNGQKNAAAAYNPTNPYQAMISNLYNFKN